jgi:transposase
VDGNALTRQYKNKTSDFKEWKANLPKSDALVFKGNISEFISIDETSLSNGELYTVITSKKGKGKKGTLIAMIKGTKSEEIIKVLESIPNQIRNKVKEITLDMAAPMISICKTAFPKAVQVTDRFHVQKLAHAAVQDLRIKHRWEALDQENREMEKAKTNNTKYIPELFENGDTLKQLLARSRYILFKHHHKWTVKQKQRAEILFHKYPNIKVAYQLSMELFNIYQNTKIKGVAFTKLAQWYEQIEQSQIQTFSTVKRTIQQHYSSILNYFDHRSTNASAESFNSKIKGFRLQLRGVRDSYFFLFRLSKIYA